MCSLNPPHKRVTVWQNVAITETNLEERGHNLMPLSHLVGISRNQAESAGIKVPADSGGDFKSARMPLDYFEPP